MLRQRRNAGVRRDALRDQRSVRPPRPRRVLHAWQDRARLARRRVHEIDHVQERMHGDQSTRPPDRLQLAPPMAAIDARTSQTPTKANGNSTFHALELLRVSSMI